jgi:hypothetical protein
MRRADATALAHGIDSCGLCLFEYDTSCIDVGNQAFAGARTSIDSGYDVKAHGMMRALRLTLSKLFVAVLLTLCVGVQVLEASGRWDRTLQDAGDEAVIVTSVLCIGAAIAVARAARKHVYLAAIQSLIVFIRATWQSPTSLLCLALPAFGNPPFSLRI